MAPTSRSQERLDSPVAASIPLAGATSASHRWSRNISEKYDIQFPV